MDFPDSPAPNQIRIRAVFVPDGEAVPPELLGEIRSPVRIPAELVIDPDEAEAENAEYR